MQSNFRTLELSNITYNIPDKKYFKTRGLVEVNDIHLSIASII